MQLEKEWLIHWEARRLQCGQFAFEADLDVGLYFLNRLAGISARDGFHQYGVVLVQFGWPLP